MALRSVHALQWLASARQPGVPRTRSFELGDTSDLGVTALRQEWSPGAESHRRPPLCESGALLLSYRARVGEPSSPLPHILCSAALGRPARQYRPRNLPGKNRVLCLLSYRFEKLTSLRGAEGDAAISFRLRQRREIATAAARPRNDEFVVDQA